jgi:hypothetical protein
MRRVARDIVRQVGQYFVSRGYAGVAPSGGGGVEPSGYFGNGYFGKGYFGNNYWR